MKIGQVIKALRTECGLSQESLALEVDTVTSNLSRIEKGQRTPSLDLLERLSSAFGVRTSEMFRAAEGGELPLPAKQATAATQDQGDEDYSKDALELRKIFRKLSPPNRKIALDLLKTLKNNQ